MKEDLDAQLSQNNIQQIYNNFAKFYDLWARLTETKATNRAIKLAGIEDGQSVLEVAVGTGKVFNEIVRRNSNGINIGIDVSSEMLKKAEKRLNKVENANYSLRLGNAFDTNLEGESVDLILNNYMFDLIPFDEMDRILDEFSRVLKNNGKIVLVNMTKGERLGSGLYELLYKISPKIMGGCRGVRMSGRLKRHRFQVENREYIQQMLFPSEVILAFKNRA